MKNKNTKDFSNSICPNIIQNQIKTKEEWCDMSVIYPKHISIFSFTNSVVYVHEPCYQQKHLTVTVIIMFPYAMNQTIVLITSDIWWYRNTLIITILADTDGNVKQNAVIL